MNCPNCGKPVSPAANICPKCKTHLVHEDDNHDYKDNPKAPIVKDDTPIRHGHKGLIIALIIIVVIVALAVLFVLNMEAILDYAKSHSWLNWLAKLADW